ncbi:TonB-dependent hemoglobin/transferrin/lactoferrin family receptor [Microbulbifer agarilyticus]|uniref:TonB-dependent hemoglobin/transferrin/lactoferrin family receptor n=1 Tax=Microbulbifer agarilyticus TaxID=260552 RepID=UPI001CD2F748|nr:TonB-dependent hemoglobin/transferrin/lactoferrin family receptor [Microbulbifer agarilyticus]MCA0899530.1 TonB-dependent hemoglobin/transferrin/lactoferrin family receptor [Microbulbifer agarilyticus]
MDRIKSLRIHPLTAAVLALTASTAAAEEGNADQPIIQFHEVLVAADRNPAAKEKDERILVVERTQLEEQQPESIAQALKYAPNIEVVGGPRYSNQSPNIRGLSDTRVLQTIDGARQNFSSGHRGTYQLAPELLKQVEVKKGPASSLWGSGAIGGIVAMSTKSTSDLLSGNDTFGGYVKEELGTNGNSTETTVAAYGLYGDFDYLINASVSENDNVEIGSGEELADSAGENTALLARGGFKISDNQRVDISFRHNNRDEAVPSNPNANVGTSSPLVERDITDQNVTANYWVQAGNSKRTDGAARHTTKVTVYRNDTQFEEFRPTQGDSSLGTLGQNDNTEVTTTGIAINNATEGFGAQWVYGLDWYQDDITTVRDGDNRPENMNADSDVLGVYAQAAFNFGDKVTLTPGVRYDRFEAESQQLADSARNDSAVSPSLSAEVKAAEWLSLTASYATAFRAPGVEEMYTQGTHFAYGDFSFMGLGFLANTFIPNPDLEAEEARNAELRADMAFSNLAAEGDQLTASAAIFRNKVDNFIEQVVINPHFMLGFPMNTTYLNVDKAELKGFELGVNYLVSDLELGMNYGQTEGKDLSDDSYLSNIPADKVVLDVGHYFLQRDLKAGFRTTFISAQEQLPEEETREFGKYNLTDAYVTWEPATGSLNGLKLGLAVDNLTDEEYRVAFQELYMPGRNIKLSASYRF